MITSIRFIFIILSLSFMYGCSESNGVDYMNPSPKHGFATNKEVFAAQYFASNKQWRAPQGTTFHLASQGEECQCQRLVLRDRRASDTFVLSLA